MPRPTRSSARRRPTCFVIRKQADVGWDSDPRQRHDLRRFVPANAGRKSRACRGSPTANGLLLATLGLWYRSQGSVAVETVTTPKVEAFYWATIMLSQTLGTAPGVWMADDTGLGFGGGALVFGAGLVAVSATYAFTRVSRTVLFWAAFILMRPLGATVGDFLDKPVDHGGLAFGRFSASAVLAIAIFGCILLLPQRAGHHPGEQDATA